MDENNNMAINKTKSIIFLPTTDLV